MKNFKIAITGGIGSGKSSVVEIIKKLGYTVFSCDDICRDLYKKQSVLRKLKKLFPSAVSGNIFLKADKKKISALTFNDDENYNKLSSFLQPLIVKELYRLMKKKKKGFCFAEVPLLFEGNYQNLFDKVIVVLRNYQARVESVKTRSNLTEEEISLITNRQVKHDELDLSDHIVIKNDGNLVELELKTIMALKNLSLEIVRSTGTEKTM